MIRQATTSRTGIGSKVILAAVLVISAVAFAAPAYADWHHDHRGPPPRHWHHGPRGYGYYQPEPVYAAPPPVVYAPPPQSSGINLILPLHIH